MNKKRQRAPNFSPQEISYLLSIVYGYSEVIENKRTDSDTNKKKQQCWEEITNLFNSGSPDNVKRSVNSLIKLYNNQKEKKRKTFGNEERDKFGKTWVRLLEYEKENYTLLSTDVSTIKIEETEIELNEDNDIGFEDLSNRKITDSDHDTYSSHQLPMIETGPSTSNPSKSTMTITPQKRNSTNLETSSTLKDSEVHHSKNANLNTENLLFQMLSEFYEIKDKQKNDLGQRRIKALERDEERKEIEFELRKESLKLDIMIKKETLKKLKAAEY